MSSSNTNDFGISFGSCRVIFTDALGMKRAVAKIVSKLLNFELKLRCMDIAQEMFKKICSKRSQMVTTNHVCMSMTLKPKTNHPNASVQKSQDR